MRKSLMQRLTVGVVGEGKAGKSTLVSGLLHLPTGAWGRTRTQDIALYRLGNLDVLDFPHSDSANYEVVKKAVATHSSMLDAVVVLVAAAGSNDRDGVQTALQGVTEAAMQHKAVWQQAQPGSTASAGLHQQGQLRCDCTAACSRALCRHDVCTVLAVQASASHILLMGAHLATGAPPHSDKRQHSQPVTG
jgi:hypothetical protein